MDLLKISTFSVSGFLSPKASSSPYLPQRKYSSPYTRKSKKHQYEKIQKHGAAVEGERWWVARARGVKETPHARAATDANVARVYAHAVAQVSAPLGAPKPSRGHLDVSLSVCGVQRHRGSQGALRRRIERAIDARSKFTSGSLRVRCLDRPGGARARLSPHVERAPEPSSQFFGIGVAGSKDLQSSDRSEPEGLALCERKAGHTDGSSSYVF